MGAGGHWHATRILRGLGADTASDPALRLLLARAEAGWGNWAEVAPLLERARRAAPPADARRAVVMTRLARVALAAGRTRDAVETLGSVPAPTGVVLTSWAAL